MVLAGWGGGGGDIRGGLGRVLLCGSLGTTSGATIIAVSERFRDAITDLEPRTKLLVIYSF